MSTLRSHGTVSFEADFIARLIGPAWNDPSTLNVGEWLAFVPECYRAQAIEGVQAVGARFVKRKMDRSTLHAFAAALHWWLVENVEPIGGF